MIQKMLAAYGISAASFTASLNLATDVLQFVTALIGCVTAAIGFYLLIRKLRAS